MKLRSGDPLWPSLSTGHDDSNPLTDDARCDVLVVGTGITGALIADVLTREGLGVIAVDKRKIARGSTPASTALLLYELDTPLLDLIGLHGRRNAGAAYLASVKAVHDLKTLAQGSGLNCDAADRRSLFLARSEHDDSFLLREWVARRELGIDAALLRRGELQSRFMLDRAAGILSNAALEIDPWKFTNALWSRAMNNGAHLFDRTGVASMQAKGGRQLVRTDNGNTIDCAHIVFATGYEAPEQFPTLKSLCSLRSTFVLATEPVQEELLWPGRSLIWEHGDPYLYLRTTADNRVLIGGEDIPFMGELPGDKELHDATQHLHARLALLFPHLGAARAEFAWTGVFASTPDGLPYIGKLRGADHCWLALGYGGNGITFSMIASQIISDGILAKRENPSAALFGFGRIQA